MTSPLIPDVATVLARADRAWCSETADTKREPEYLAALAAAVRAQIIEPLTAPGPHAAGQVELANTRALLGRLVKAVRGSWRVRSDHAEQVAAAIEEVEQVRAYLLSLHEPQARAG